MKKWMWFSGSLFIFLMFVIFFGEFVGMFLMKKKDVVPWCCLVP